MSSPADATRSVDAGTTVVAVDVGGTTIKAAAVTASGRIVGEAIRATPVEAGPDAVVDAIAGVTCELVDTSTQLVSVVVPGVVDVDAGVAVFAANLGWRDLPLRDRLADRLPCPVAVGHDVSAAGLAERTVGAARDRGDALVVVIGTGIAAVVISGGRIVTGHQGSAGELGHMTVRPGGEVCGCGNRGCVEAYASAAAIARRYRTLAGTGRVADAEGVVGARGHDPHAATVWAEAIGALGTGIAGAVALLDPQTVVLGGGLALAGEALRGPLAAEVAAALPWRQAPDVTLSPLGATGARTGAAVLGWRAAGQTDFSTWGPA